MSLILIGAALTLARWWTRLYTVGAPSHVARARRAEIETDLWEFERDLPQTPHGVATAWARLLFGMPDDLSWRLDHRLTGRVVWWSGPVAAGVLVSIFWLISNSRNFDLPLPPTPPPAAVANEVPPPPVSAGVDLMFVPVIDLGTALLNERVAGLEAVRRSTSSSTTTATSAASVWFVTVNPD